MVFQVDVGGKIRYKKYQILLIVIGGKQYSIQMNSEPITYEKYITHVRKDKLEFNAF